MKLALFSQRLPFERPKYKWTNDDWQLADALGVVVGGYEDQMTGKQSQGLWRTSPFLAHLLPENTKAHHRHPRATAAHNRQLA